MRRDKTELGPALILAGLCLLLLLIYLPSFANPPHGDYWEAFYSFQQYRAAPAARRLLLIVNHDPWQDGTFRPFSYLFLYLAHALFGSEFIWYGIFNFLLYCLSVFLLYRLAVGLKLRRMVSAALIGVYIFLFSHSGILTLTFHQFVIAGFSAMLGGFLLYLRRLETRRTRFLILAGLLFLFGMLCYEAFILWPLSILILHRLFRLRSRRRTGGGKRTGCHWDIFLLAAVYLVYLGIFRLTRTAGVAAAPLPEFTPGQIGLSLCAVFFNLAYNGVVVNLCPFVSLPGRFQDWVEMGGLINRIPEDSLPAVIAVAGIMTMILIAVAGRILYRRRQGETLLTLGFLLFLYAANFFTVFLARIALGDLHHILVQFRYQYIPNGLLVLMAAAVFGPFLARGGRRRAVIFSIVIALVLIANIVVSLQTVRTVNRHLAPLQRVLNRVRAGIDSGEINPREPILIQRGITRYLPQLCWQSGIGRRMQGSYEWVFYPRYGDCFTRLSREADWILDSPLGNYRRIEYEEE